MYGEHLLWGKNYAEHWRFPWLTRIWIDWKNYPIQGEKRLTDSCCLGRRTALKWRWRIKPCFMLLQLGPTNILLPCMRSLSESQIALLQGRIRWHHTPTSNHRGFLFRLHCPFAFNALLFRKVNMPLSSLPCSSGTPLMHLLKHFSLFPTFWVKTWVWVEARALLCLHSLRNLSQFVSNLEYWKFLFGLLSYLLGITRSLAAMLPYS